MKSGRRTIAEPLELQPIAARQQAFPHYHEGMQERDCKPVIAAVCLLQLASATKRSGTHVGEARRNAKARTSALRI